MSADATRFVSFSLYSRKVRHEQMAAQIGMAPDAVWTIGMPIREDRPERLAKEHCWTLEQRGAYDVSFNELLDRLLRRIDEHTVAIRELTNTGDVEARLSLWWTDGGQYESRFPLDVPENYVRISARLTPTQVKWLASVHAKFEFD